MRTNRAARRIVTSLIALAVLAGVVAFAWAIALPWSANHYGFALPGGTDGMPYRIHYNGRSYATHGICARAGWCSGELNADITSATLISEGSWPLTQVTTVPTFLGAAHPVFAVPSSAGMTTMMLYVPDGSNRYITYTIEGGP